MTAGMAIWAIVALAIAGVILRPWRLPEAAVAAVGAVALVAFGLLPAEDAWIGIRRGSDVYLFLIGMMLLAELARGQGLFDWLARFSLPSLLAILATYVVLLLTQKQALRQPIEGDVSVPALSPGGRAAGFGIVATAAALMAASALDLPLGLATCIAGTVTAVCVLVLARQAPWKVLGGVAWGVLPLVAGLFVLVKALDRIGAIRALSETLRQSAETSVTGTAWAAGTIVALACNLVTNLPAGLVACTAVQAAQTPSAVTGAILIGVDLGPNLSVTGSLATILWLGALRRDGLGIDARSFLKLGATVMPPALILALGALIWRG